MAALQQRIASLEALEAARRNAIIEQVVVQMTDAELDVLEAYAWRRDTTLGGSEPSREEEVVLWRYHELYADAYEATYGHRYPRPSDFDQGNS